MIAQYPIIFYIFAAILGIVLFLFGKNLKE